jgi:hypothetical protein
MTKITRCKLVGLHYNGFLKIWDESTFVFIAESLINIFKIICFACYCGTWANKMAREYRFLNDGLLDDLPKWFQVF